jgi:uncharacterized protein
MTARIIVFIAVASLVLGGAHWYVWARLVRDSALPAPWDRAATLLVAALFVVLIGGVVASRALPRSVSSPILWFAYTWLGVLFLLVVSVGITDVVKLFALRGIDDPERRRVLVRIFAGAAAALGIGASGIAIASGLAPVDVKRLRIAIDRLSKDASGLRIVQLTDIHVGPTIGRDFIERIVAKVNALSPDVIAITGDLVDGSVSELREHVAPLAKLRARYGVYFVTGNHEYYSGVDEWIAHLRSLGIRVLRNERVRIAGDEGIDLAGIDDHEAGVPGHGSDLRRALDGRDPERPCVLLAHQPRGIHLADALGVDLQLSGHTHGGQLYPWRFLVRLQQPFVEGLHRLARAQIYVSRGTGYWGPPMRLGAPAEITEIELVPAV